MAHDSYDVHEPTAPRRPKKDASFRSFLCVILIFFALCMLLIIIGNWPRKSQEPKKDVEIIGEHDDREFDRIYRLTTQENAILTTVLMRKPATTTTTTTTPKTVIVDEGKSKKEETKTSTTTTTTTTPKTVIVVKEKAKKEETNTLTTTTSLIEGNKSGSTIEENNTAVIVDEEKTKLKDAMTLNTTPENGLIEDTQTGSSVEENSANNTAVIVDEEKSAKENKKTLISTTISPKSALIEDTNYGPTDKIEVLVVGDKYKKTSTTKMPITSMIEDTGSTIDDITTNEADIEEEEKNGKDERKTSTSTTTAPKTVLIEEIKSTNKTDENKAKKEETTTTKAENSKFGSMTSNLELSTLESTSVESDTESTMMTPKKMSRLKSVESKKSKRKSYIDEDVCEKPSCKTVASRMLSSMDFSQDPCEDFHAYACGNFLPNSHLAEDNELFKLMMNAKDPILRNYKEYYQSCTQFRYKLNEAARLEKLQKYFQYYNTKDSYELLANAISLNYFHFAEIGVTLGPEFTPILQLRLPRRVPELWLNPQKCRSFKLLSSVDEISCTDDCLDGRSQFTEVLGMLSAIYPNKLKNQLEEIWKIYPKQNEINEQLNSANSTIYTIGDLQKKWSHFNLSTVFQYLDVSMNASVEVFFEDYFDKLLNILSKRNAKFFNDYIALNMFYEFVVKKSNDAGVENYCLQEATEAFNDIASYLYLEHANISSKISKELPELFNLLNDILMKGFDHAKDVMDLKKDPNIKRPNLRLVLNDKANGPKLDDIKKKYSKLKLQRDDYVENYCKVGIIKSSHLFNAVKGNIFGYFVNSFEKKPVSFYSTNNIYVPAGNLIEAAKVPKNLLTWKVVFPLTMAMARFFDYAASKNFMDASVKKENFKLVDDDSIMDMEMSELSAGNTALLLLEMAMQNDTDNAFFGGDAKNLPWISNNHTREQIMYLGVAQEYCEKLSKLESKSRSCQGPSVPPEKRVNTFASNSMLFNNNYNCVEGSAMNKYGHVYQFPLNILYDSYESEDIDDN